MVKKKHPQKPAEKPDRKNLLLRAGLLFFISAWMFFLGILVGRGTSPVHFDIDRLQKELAALKKSSIQKEIKRYKINSPDSLEKSDFGFHKTLKSPEENIPLSKKEPVRQKPVQTAPENPLPAQARQPAAKEHNNELYSKAMTESGRSFTIQLAASQDKKYADGMVSRLKEKNYPAYLETAKIAGKGTWYRVRIGGFRDRDEANRFLDTLKKNNLNGMVIKR